jgi:hypothetical protein
MKADPHRIDPFQVFDLLEMQAGMMRILLEQAVGFSRLTSDFFR